MKQSELIPTPAAAPAPREYTAKEWRVSAMREMPLPDEMVICDTPDKAAAYWREIIVAAPWYRQEVEQLVVLHLNTRRRVTGHHLVSIGTQDTILCHAREIFRAAIVASAAAIIVMHNHPSGDPSPSDADIKVTRDLIRAGQLLKLDVLDHVITGARQTKASLRELGYFYN